MIILSWNCRGLAQASTIRALRAMIRRNHPDIIFLSETKTNLACSILLQLGYSLSIQAPPSGSRGGLLIAWHSDVKLTSLFVSHNLICVHYFSTSPDVKCLISFVYGPPYQKNVSDFGHSLGNLVLIARSLGFALVILTLLLRLWINWAAGLLMFSPTMILDNS
jgi:hypothetical protein